MAVAVLHTFGDQTSILLTAKFCPIFLLFRRERLFSLFVTPDFKKGQNWNETPLKNGTKFTGIFAFLMIKL